MSGQENRLPSSFDDEMIRTGDPLWKRMWNRTMKEPLVPVGIALTTLALLGASRAIYKGDSVQANVMFRRRVYAQAFTVIAMTTGSMYWGQERLRQKELVKAQEQADKKSSLDRWLHKLELFDEQQKTKMSALSPANPILPSSPSECASPNITKIADKSNNENIIKTDDAKNRVVPTPADPRAVRPAFEPEPPT